MDFLDFVLRLNGKGGPSLLVPSGVLNSIQFRTSFAFHEPSFDFHVLEKTSFLLGNSSIPPKSWSDSSIPSVDMFTGPL